MWQRFKREDRGVGEITDTGDAVELRDPRATADVDEDPLGLQRLVADRHAVMRREPRVTLDDGTAPCLAQGRFDAVSRARRDGVGPRLRAREVEADRARERDAVRSGSPR